MCEVLIFWIVGVFLTKQTQLSQRLGEVCLVKDDLFEDLTQEPEDFKEPY